MRHLRILGAERVTRSKFCTEDPQTFGATAQNLVARDLCTPKLLPDLQLLIRNLLCVNYNV